MVKLPEVPNLRDPSAMAEMMKPHFHLLKNPKVQDDIKRCMEDGVMKDLGFEDEKAALFMTMCYQVLLHAHPELVPKLNPDGTPKANKPLTGSQKRALARDKTLPFTQLPTRQRPDESVELRPDQFKVVEPDEERLKFDKPTYVNKAHKPLPEGFEPIGPITNNKITS